MRALAAPLPGVSYRSATRYAPYGLNPPFVVRERVTECPTMLCRVSTRDRAGAAPGYRARSLHGMAVARRCVVVHVLDVSYWTSVN